MDEDLLLQSDDDGLGVSRASEITHSLGGVHIPSVGRMLASGVGEAFSSSVGEDYFVPEVGDFGDTLTKNDAY